MEVIDQLYPYLDHMIIFVDVSFGNLLTASVCRFKSLSYYRHLAASPSFGGQLLRRGVPQAPATYLTMEMPLDEIRLTLKSTDTVKK